MAHLAPFVAALSFRPTCRFSTPMAGGIMLPPGMWAADVWGLSARGLALALAIVGNR